MELSQQRALLALGTALLTASCAAGEFGPDNPGDPCETLLTVTPQQPRVGDTVTLTASTRGGAVVGFERFAWSVRLGSEPVALAAAEPEGPVVSFVAERAGTYELAVQASVGELSCSGAQELATIVLPGARSEQYRLRLVPPAELAVPPQDMTISVFGGADANLGTLALSIGAPALIYVTTGASQPVAAYLRFTPTDDPQAPSIEAFTDESGTRELVLESRRYDVLVVPEDNNLAPLHVSGRRVFELPLAPGTPITGTVADGQGRPLTGARVSLRTIPTTAAADSQTSVPSTLGTTDAAGAFVLTARAGSARGLAVVPPPGSGLPLLELEPVAELASATSLAIAYAPLPMRTSIAPRVVLSDGATAAPATRVTWLGTIDQAGTGSVAGGSAMPASGMVRVVQTADASGALPPVTLPEALYDVILEPAAGTAAGQGVTLVSVDLRAGASVPARLALAPATRLSAIVRDAQDRPVGGARATAVPTGLLAQASSATIAATSAQDGRIELALAAGGAYELVIDSPDSRHARMRQVVQVPQPGEPASLGILRLQAAVRASGRLVIAGQPGGAGEVSVRLLCLVCGDAEASVPLAETRTDKAGYFTISIPDPGVQ